MYQATRNHITEDPKYQNHCSDNIKPHTAWISSKYANCKNKKKLSKYVLEDEQVEQ